MLWLGSDNIELLGFSDADYARDVDDRHSTSGYVFMLGDGCISWYSGKQKGVATSTAQAEYIALSQATKEAVFLCQLLSEFEGVGLLDMLSSRKTIKQPCRLLGIQSSIQRQNTSMSVIILFVRL